MRSAAEQSYVEQISARSAGRLSPPEPADPPPPTELGLPAVDPATLPRTRVGMPAVAPVQRQEATLASPTGAPPHVAGGAVGSQPTARWQTAPQPTPTRPPARPSPERSGWLFLGGMTAVLVVVALVAALIWLVVRVRSSSAVAEPAAEQVSGGEGVLAAMTEQQLLRRVRRVGWSVDDQRIQRVSAPHLWGLSIPVSHPTHGMAVVSMYRPQDPAVAQTMADNITTNQPAVAVHLEDRTVLWALCGRSPSAARSLVAAVVR